MPKRQDPCAIVCGQLAARPAAERVVFLHQLMAHAGAGLVVIKGDEAAAEDIYRLADAIVDRAHNKAKT